MTSDSAHRGIRLERIGNSRYTASNERGGQISLGTGEGTDFTPIELLLAAVRMSHDRLCSVGRTVELGTPIATRID